MGRVYNEQPSGRVVVQGDGGGTAWSTDRRPVNLLPEANWISQALTVAFPDFTKFINYGHLRYWQPPTSLPGGQWTPSESGDICSSITMIEPEDRVLAPVTIATVPAGVNFIDVRVQLNRTKAPSQYLNQVPPSLIPNNWVNLRGDSCLVEATDIWRRSFDIVLNGQNVQLIRRQSVAKVGSAEYPRENIRSNAGGKAAGAAGDPWGHSTISYWGNVNAAGTDYTGTQRDGHPAALIEAKDFSANVGLPGWSTPTYGGKHLRRFNACSINNASHDFSSTYTGQIVVRPGYIAG